ncbi:hypothetical protein ACIBQ1_39370 [Nonomuraea sp. NPDC050153]|uniref:hypothetical protein n=1 Tax=Nonomuraea sp. NPDC050153 TaxID=3364359 RepID=UPI003791F121
MAAAQRSKKPQERVADRLDRLTEEADRLEKHAPTAHRSGQAQELLGKIRSLETELRRQPRRHSLTTIFEPKDTPSAELLARTSGLASRVEALIPRAPGSRPESGRRLRWWELADTRPQPADPQPAPSPRRARRPQPTGPEPVPSARPAPGPRSGRGEVIPPKGAGSATAVGSETVLTVGRQSSAGVTVKETLLGERTRKVDIRGSCGVVVGSGNRQHNHFHYHLADRPVSLKQVLTPTPAHERALANLIRNPDSARANHAMRSLLGKEAAKVLARGDAVTTKSAPKPVRLSGVLGPGGEIAVRGSKGVVVGRGNVQNNHFHYRLEQPAALLSRALAENAGAMRAIGRMYRDPASRMTGRDLSTMLTRLVTAKTQVADVVRDRGSRTERVADGRGVMLGSDNVRTDEIHSPDHQVWSRILKGAVDQNVPTSADTTPSVDREPGQSLQSPSSRDLSRDRW